jgi:AcrR family transcriptional regulator
MARTRSTAAARSPRAARSSRLSGAAPRTKPSEIRREDLMRAGESVILARGLGAASVDEIAGAASVAKGTFYLYFASKDELVEALRARSLERIHRRIHEFSARVASDDWAGRLDAFIEGGVRGYLEQLAIHDVLFHGPHQPGPRGDVVGDDAIVTELAEFLAAGARAGAFTVESPQLAAALFFHALHGGVDYVFATEKRVDRKRLIARLQAFFRRSVGA